MIHVRNLQDDHWTIEVKGHANAAPHGEDIVCAGVSALTIHLVNALTEIVKLNSRQLQYAVREGYVKITVDPDTLDGDTRKQTEMFIHAFGLSLRDMQESYPEFVSYHEGGGWNGKNESSIIRK